MSAIAATLSSQVSVPGWLASGYALVLLAVAYGVDSMARRASRSAALNSTGGFTYHESHDAWLCPQDQWLWPTSFDPDNRVMRYRASPLVCGSCPVKDTCTSAPSREIARAIDPWPASEAARFHRGIACAVVAMAVAWPVAMLFTRPQVVELVLLIVVAFTVAGAGLPLFAHLVRTPANFPVPVRLETLDEAALARALPERARARRGSRYRSVRIAETGADERGGAGGGAEPWR